MRCKLISLWARHSARYCSIGHGFNHHVDISWTGTADGNDAVKQAFRENNRAANSIENPFEGGGLKVEIADDGQSWVRNVNINESERTISFDYDANEYPIERKATLYISYDYSEVCIFELTQIANVATEEIEFEISIDEVHYDRVVVSCTPSNQEVEYVLGAIAKRDFESSSHNSDPTKIPELDLVASFPTYQILSGTQGGVTLTNTAISYDTNWYIYAYAINPAHDAAISEVKMVLAG